MLNKITIVIGLIVVLFLIALTIIAFKPIDTVLVDHAKITTKVLEVEQNQDKQIERIDKEIDNLPRGGFHEITY